MGNAACTCQGFYQPPDCPVHGRDRAEPPNGMEPDDPNAEFIIDGRGRSLRSLMGFVRDGHVSEEEAVRLLRDWKGKR